MQILRFTWRWMFGFFENNTASEWYMPDWAGFLRWIWYCLVFVSFLLWVVHPTSSNLLGLIFVIVFHSVWYICGFLSQTREHNEEWIQRIDNEWGVLSKVIQTNDEVCGKSLAELDLRRKSLLVLAINRERQVLPFPKGNEVIELGDCLVIFGDLRSYRIWFGEERFSDS